MKYKQVRILGVVIASSWDEKGRPTAVSLATAEETIELSADKLSEHELINLIHKHVEITGLSRVQSGRKNILVVNYQLKDTPQ